jgi:hypothetical protein
MQPPSSKRNFATIKPRSWQCQKGTPIKVIRWLWKTTYARIIYFILLWYIISHIQSNKEIWWEVLLPIFKPYVLMETFFLPTRLLPLSVVEKKNVFSLRILHQSCSLGRIDVWAFESLDFDIRSSKYSRLNIYWGSENSATKFLPQKNFSAAGRV